MTANRCELTRWHPFKSGGDLPKKCVKSAGHDGMCRDYRGDYEGSKGRAREMTPEEVDAHNLSDDAESDTVLHTCERPVETSVIVRTPHGVGTVHACETHSGDAMGTARAARLSPVAVHADGKPVCGSLRADPLVAVTIRAAFETDVFGCVETACALLYGHDGFHMGLEAREWADQSQLRTLRIIAGDWHDGQTSQLYAFTSTGRVDDVDDALREIEACDRHAGVSQTRRLRWLASYFTTLVTDDEEEAA